MESMRLVLAIIAFLKMSIFQVDFTAAFLNSPITHDIYMKQPEGFIEPGTEHLVCKLKKLIYGTMQGSHDWPQDTTRMGILHHELTRALDTGERRESTPLPAHMVMMFVAAPQQWRTWENGGRPMK